MSSNLVTISEKRFNPILTRAGDPSALTFKTIDDKALAEINDFMLVVNQKVNAFNKQNTQTTSSLMTLNMIDSAPYRVLRQILAQIENKRSALKENIYNLEKKKIEYRELSQKEELTDLEDLEIRKVASDMIDAQGHIEAAIKEIYALKARYQEICKNKEIPENWGELEVEEQEIEHHIKSIFRNMIRDRMAGTSNHGSTEYAEQFGVHPVVAYACVDQYLKSIYSQMNDTGMGPDITSLHKFYDDMYLKFGGEYKKSMKRIGLDSIIHAESLFKNT